MALDGGRLLSMSNMWTLRPRRPQLSLLVGRWFHRCDMKVCFIVCYSNHVSWLSGDKLHASPSRLVTHIEDAAGHFARAFAGFGTLSFGARTAACLPALLVQHLNVR